MREVIKQIKQSVALLAGLSMALGLVLLFFPAVTAAVLSYAVGTLILVYGVMRIISFFTKPERTFFFRLDLVFGILCVLLALFLFIRPGFLVSIFPVLFGLIAFIGGLVNLQQSFELKREGSRSWWISLILAVATMILGLVLFFRPFTAATTFMRFVGICLIVNAVSDLWTYFKMKRMMKQIAEESGVLESKGKEIK